MVVMAVHRVPSLTQARYEEVIRRLTNGKSRLDSLSDLPFDGVLMHVTGQTEQGFCVVDVFESEEAVERFNQAMGTISQRGWDRGATGVHPCSHLRLPARRLRLGTGPYPVASSSSRTPTGSLRRACSACSMLTKRRRPGPARPEEIDGEVSNGVPRSTVDQTADLRLPIAAMAAECPDRGQLAGLRPTGDGLRVHPEHGRDLGRSQKRLRVLFDIDHSVIPPARGCPVSADAPSLYRFGWIMGIGPVDIKGHLPCATKDS